MEFRLPSFNRVILLCILLISASSYSCAQQDSVYRWKMRANVQRGLLLPEYGFMSLQSSEFISGAEVNIRYQTAGNTIWERMYRRPAVGISAYWSTLGSAEYYGQQFALYPYYALNLIHKNRFRFDYQMGVGAAYVTKKFHQYENYSNVAIGSHFNIHFHADLVTSFKVNDRNQLELGLSFAHVSNANLSEPNVGLNWSSLWLGYNFASGKKQAVVNESFDKLPAYFIHEIMLTGGMKHTRTFESFQYPAMSLSYEVKRRTGYKFAIGAGADVFYDASIEPQMNRLNKPYSGIDSWLTGIHFTQEFFYNKVSFIVQEGFYLGLTDKLNGYFMYNRAMIRYRFTDHLMVNASMKSHLYILDFPELGIGFFW
jgi:hypothetical protein